MSFWKIKHTTDVYRQFTNIWAQLEKNLSVPLITFLILITFKLLFLMEYEITQENQNLYYIKHYNGFQSWKSFKNEFSQKIHLTWNHLGGYTFHPLGLKFCLEFFFYKLPPKDNSGQYQFLIFNLVAWLRHV